LVVLDIVIKYPAGWIRLDRYADFAQGTNPMDRREPDGGNIGFLKGQVAWRHFQGMYERYRVQGVVFWG
jgi:hypothetical protein